MKQKITDLTAEQISRALSMLEIERHDNADGYMESANISILRSDGQWVAGTPSEDGYNIAGAGATPLEAAEMCWLGLKHGPEIDMEAVEAEHKRELQDAWDARSDDEKLKHKLAILGIRGLYNHEIAARRIAASNASPIQPRAEAVQVTNPGFDAAA